MTGPMGSLCQPTRGAERRERVVGLDAGRDLRQRGAARLRRHDRLGRRAGEAREDAVALGVRRMRRERERCRSCEIARPVGADSSCCGPSTPFGSPVPPVESTSCRRISDGSCAQMRTRPPLPPGGVRCRRCRHRRARRWRMRSDCTTISTEPPLPPRAPRPATGAAFGAHATAERQRAVRRSEEDRRRLRRPASCRWRPRRPRCRRRRR